MELLLVNCYRENAAEKVRSYHEWLAAGAAGAGLELALREAGDGGPFPAAGEFAAVIVSGSQKMVGDGEIEPALLSFLKGSRRPLLGICYGHQALAAAFGARVRRDGRRHLGDEEIRIGAPAGLFAGFPAAFPMRESHEEVVVRDAALELEFRVAAESGSGLVEAIVHREAPLYGVQFHPEKSGAAGVRLLVNFLKTL